MSGAVDLLRRLAAVEQRSGQIYDQIACTYVPLTTALVEVGGSLAGAALNVGTYTVGPVGGGATYSFNYPTTAKAINVFLAAKWASAADGNVAYLRPSGSTAVEALPQVRGLVANITSDGAGLVSLNASGLAQIVVLTANTAAFYLRIMGYFL